MKANTRYLDQYGIEYAVWLMAYLAITQGMNVGTHRYSLCIDNAGRDLGKDPVFAPTQIKVVKVERNNNGNAVVVESTAPKHLANGVYDYFCIRAVHDDYIGDIPLGKVYQQGEKWYDEGRSGQATGNHVHFSFAIGKYAGEVKNEAGYFELKNEADPRDIFFVNDTVMLKPLYTGWKEYKPMPITKALNTTLTTDKTVLRLRLIPDTTGEMDGFVTPNVDHVLLDTVENDGWVWGRIVHDTRIRFCAIKKTDGTDVMCTVKAPQTKDEIDRILSDNEFSVHIVRKLNK